MEPREVLQHRGVDVASFGGQDNLNRGADEGGARLDGQVLKKPELREGFPQLSHAIHAASTYSRAPEWSRAGPPRPSRLSPRGALPKKPGQAPGIVAHPPGRRPCV